MVKVTMASGEEFVDRTGWTKDQLQLLVSLYANEELLWNTSCPEYHHKELRKEAFNRIAETMDLPLEAILRKVQNMRTYYTRELSKTKKYSGTPYKSRWPLYKILDSFLHEHIQHRKSSADNGSLDNSATDVDEDSEDLRTEDIKLLMGQPTVIKTNSVESPGDSGSKKRNNESVNQLNKRLKTQSNSPETLTINGAASQSNLAEDPDAVFGRHVANELRLIKDLKSKQFAKLQIHNILFNAQFGLATIPQEINIPTID